MIYIAHRGLFTGPDKVRENHPDQIKIALEHGFQCEIDVRVVDSKLYLGHDTPDYEIDVAFLHDYRFWVHAKNIEALELLNESILSCNYFWHQNDSYTLTSKQYVWVNPGEDLIKRSVMVMPEIIDPLLVNTLGQEVNECYAICSDYVKVIKEMRCE